MQMTNKIMSKAWISPITSVTFILVSMSGIFLAFHIRVGNLKALHEWIGYVFTVAGVIHLLMNWKAFAAYFRMRTAAIAVFACVIVSLAVLGTKVKQKPDQLIQLLDANRNGVIDESEILSATIAIKDFDANKDGRISTDELRPKSRN